MDYYDKNAKRKIKVVEYIGSLGTGGAETVVKDYALNIDRDVFDIIILTLSKKMDSPNERQIKVKNIEVIFLDEEIKYYTNLPRKINTLIRIIKEKYLFYKYIKEIRPDIIHLHLGGFELLKFVPFNILKNIRLIFTVHSTPNEMIIKGNLYKDIMKLIRKYGLQIIALHNTMAGEINKIFNINSTIVLPNGIDLERFRESNKPKNLLRKEHNIPEDAFVIGHIGRFSYPKNHKFLIEIFAEVSKVKGNSHLLLVGSGNLKTTIIKDLINRGLYEQTTVLENRSDVPELLHAMDVFVFPSIYEGFGVSVIEAQAAGLRCIVSDALPTSTYATDELIALGLDKSPKQWCDVILDDSIYGNKISDINDFEISSIVKKLQEVYYYVLGGNNE